MATPSIPALILGHGITALGVQRVLAADGIPYYTVESDDPLVTRSRHYNPLPRDLQGVHQEELAQWLEALPFGRAVLLPCSDHWVRSVADLPDTIRSRFPASVADRQVIDRLVDKARFAETLRRLNVPHPRSRVVRSREELDSVLDEGFEAAFLKPRDSARFFRDFGRKAFSATSRDELASRLESVTSAGHGVIVQEYVPGPATNHVFIDGFRDRTGYVTALFVRQRLRMYPPEFGNSTYMRSTSVERAGEAAAELRRLLESLEYRGVFSGEFKRDLRDGTFRLLEVNPRPWWYVEFAARCGVDVCAMAYRDALGEHVKTVTSYREGRACVYPYMDYFACRSGMRMGELSGAGAIRSWLGAAQPVFRWTDPWPAVAGMAKVLAAKIAPASQVPRQRRHSND